MRLRSNLGRHFILFAGMSAVGWMTVSGPLASTYAADIFYADTGGNFNSALSWTGGVVPGVNDKAIFNTGDQALAIDFTQNHTVQVLDIRDAGVTFDLSGFTFEGTSFNSLLVGNSSATTSLATFLSSAPGGAVITDNITIAAPSGGTADMIVTGANFALTQNTFRSLTIGNNFNGGSASLSISDQATFSTGAGTTIVGRTGSINVATNAVFNANGNINVNGGSITGLQGTNFFWAAGKTLTVQNGGSVSTFSSNYFTPAGAAIIVTGSGSSISGAGNFFQLSNGSTFDVNNGGNMSKLIFINDTSLLTVDGPGSTLGGFGVNGSSVVTLTNGATASSSFIDVGGSGAGTSTLNILSGSTVNKTATSAFDISDNSFDANGVVNIDGVGSSLSTVNAIIGSTSGSTGTLNLDNGGTYNASGTTTLNATGSININGGSALLGTFVDNGGTLNFTSGTFGHNGNVTIGVGGPVGSIINTATKSLIFGGTITVDPGSSLNVNGGIVSAGSIQNLGALTFTSGTLELTSDDLEVDFGGLLSRTPSVLAGQDIKVTNSVNISGVGLLTMNGGSITAGTLNNSGIVQMNSFSALIDGGTFMNAGTVRGTGLINASLNNTAPGVVDVSTWDNLIFNGTGNTNSGLIQNQGGTLQFNGDLTNNTGGTITARGSLRLIGGLTNDGNLAFSTGVSDVFGPITNSTGGQVSVAGGSATSFFGPIANSGDVFVGFDSRAIFFGDVSGPGSFSGTGVVEFTGGFSPGASPAIVTFGGDVLLSGSANLLIELGGLAAGSAYDRLDIAGALGLDGVLDVSLINAFTPGNGDSFDILNWGSLAGSFSAINLPALGGGLNWDTSNLLIDGTLSVVSSALVGDLDGDGFVGINDLNIVLSNWNQNVPPANPLADPSGDGFVGIDDLNAVLGNWNAGTPPTNAAGNVPEPGLLTVFLLSTAVLGRRPR